jgi:hypothetical protein
MITLFTLPAFKGTKIDLIKVSLITLTIDFLIIYPHF